MKIEKVEKLVPDLYDKTVYTIYIKNLKPALKHGRVLKKVHRVIKLNQKVWWIKSYSSMNTDSRKTARNDFQKDIFKLMNNSVFGKLWKMSKNIGTSNF